MFSTLYHTYISNKRNSGTSTSNSVFDFEFRFYIPLNTKSDHFGDVLPSQSLGLVQKKLNLTQLEIWANAQRDGRPAEYRWRPLFNTAKFGWYPILECRAVTLPRRETRWNLQGCPKLTKQSQRLVGRSSPYCGGHVEEILLLNKFFSNCRYVC